MRPDLLRLPLDLDAVDAAGDWLRYTVHAADPRLRPQPPADNRWQRGSIVDALYLASDEPTLWAEWYRHLPEGGLPPGQALPCDVWRFRVPAVGVADLTDHGRLARVGLPMPTPGRSSWPPYQNVGETLCRDGWRGLLAPSAARPEGLVLCLFTDDASAVPAEPVPPPTIVSEPPPPPTGMRT